MWQLKDLAKQSSRAKIITVKGRKKRSAHDETRTDTENNSNSFLLVSCRARGILASWQNTILGITGMLQHVTTHYVPVVPGH